MAFLDNSGDIILDAVLTDVGRRRMAAGNFRITKFALGDDEISYSLYNKEHPSGSAYYDLELLQTPIFEAFTGKVTSAINYGLTSYARKDLLYLPSIKLNEKDFSNRIAQINSTQRVIYVCDESRRTAAGFTTAKALINSLKSVGTANATNNVIRSADRTSNYAFFEVGILNTELDPTSNNQSVFLGKTGLMDRNFIVSFDNRFFAGVQSANQNSSFSNSGNSPLNVTLGGSNQVLNDKSLRNHSEMAIPAVPNRMYSDFSNNAANDNSNQYSCIDGPRAVFGAVAPIIKNNIGSSIFRRWGTINTVMISGDTTSQQYDFIDSTIYVRGLTSNTVLQLPFRIVRVSDNT